VPKISGLNLRNKPLARDNHTKGRKGEIRNERLDKVFDTVLRFMAGGQRHISYKELSEFTSLEIGVVRYYFKKLVIVGAISLDSQIQQNTTEHQ
jgi:hypothetical protein